jgi:hypothetical protein
LRDYTRGLLKDNNDAFTKEIEKDEKNKIENQNKKQPLSKERRKDNLLR